MSNQQPVTQEEILDDKLALVTVNISCYSGYRRATRDHIKEMGGSLPSSDAITEGSIKVFPPSRLKSFGTIRRGVFRKLASVGVKALGSGNTFAVPRTELTKLFEGIDESRKEFDDALAELDANYDQWFKDHVASDPAAAGIIRKLAIPQAVAMTRFGFSTHVFKIVPIANPDADESDVETIVEGLARQLFEEVSAEALDLLEKSDAFVKQKAGQKTLRPIKDALRKMRGLQFLDPLVGQGIKLIEDVLSVLPTTGFIEDSALVRPFSWLKRLVEVMSDVDDFADAAGRVGNGIPAELVLFPSSAASAPAAVAAAALAVSPSAPAPSAPLPQADAPQPTAQTEAQQPAQVTPGKETAAVEAEAAPELPSTDLPITVPVATVPVAPAPASVSFESLMF